MKSIARITNGPDSGEVSKHLDEVQIKKLTEHGFCPAAGLGHQSYFINVATARELGFSFTTRQKRLLNLPVGVINDGGMTAEELAKVHANLD